MLSETSHRLSFAVERGYCSWNASRQRRYRTLPVLHLRGQSFSRPSPRGRSSALQWKLPSGCGLYSWFTFTFTLTFTFTSLSPSTPPSPLLSQSIQRDLTYHGISRRHGRRDGRTSSSEPRSRSDSTATNDQAGTLSSTLSSSFPLTSTRNPDPCRWKIQCNRAPPKLSWQVEWALPLAAPSASS